MKARTWLGAATGLLVAAFGLAQMHPFGDPRNTSSQPRASLLSEAPMPAAARTVLITKCADCHSDATHWPPYTRLAPISWLTERDVLEGRKHLNLSHWNELSDEKRQDLSTEIVSEARKGAMPLLPYRLAHPGSTLTAADIAALATLAPAGENSGETVPGDATRGQAIFARRCTGCHTLDSNREGPSLRGVYGRKAASIQGFDYSPALRKSGLTWSGTNLERRLRDSDEMVPQSAMGFAVASPQDRADLINFLIQQQ